MKLFVTGVSGYLGVLLTRALEEDPSIEKVVGIDLKPPLEETSKLEFHRMDVRDPSIRDVMKGADAAIHMAFIVDEIKDKEKTYDVNVNGSRNVFDACIEVGVPWIIQLSSMAAFGPHPDNPVPIRETDFPRGAHDVYYCYGKAELEHYLARIQCDHPELKVTILRPSVIIGDNTNKSIPELFKGPVAARLKGHNSLAQFVHEDDVVESIELVLKKQAKGIYHITSDDYISIDEMMRRTGLFAPQLPVGFLCKFADIAFALGISPASSHWIRMFAYSMVGSNEKAKSELGWVPTYTSSELFDKFVVRPKKKKF